MTLRHRSWNAPPTEHFDWSKISMNINKGVVFGRSTDFAGSIP